jgi:hypothetical protein
MTNYKLPFLMKEGAGGWLDVTLSGVGGKGGALTQQVIMIDSLK